MQIRIIFIFIVAVSYSQWFFHDTNGSMGTTTKAYDFNSEGIKNKTRQNVQCTEYIVAGLV